MIVAIDGLKASEKLLAQYVKQQGEYVVHAFRRDELLQFTVKAAEIGLVTVDLKVVDQSKAENWLKV